MINTVIHGDCLEVMKSIPDKSIDLCFTSPPYNMRLRIRNGKYTSREKAEHFSKKYRHFNDDMPIEDFYQFHKKCLTEMLRVSRVVTYNIQIVTGSKEAFFRMIGNFNTEIKDIIVWDKGSGQPAMHGGILNSAYELILVMESDGKKGRQIQNANFKRGELQNILRIKRGRKVSSGHSAVFPEELAEKIIESLSKPDQVVLDPFAGTGTTAIAAIKTGRNYILIEKEKEYIDIINERISKLSAKGGIGE